MDRRRKVPLRPGFTLADWSRLSARLGGHESGGGGRFTRDQVRAHRTRDDCWIILYGRVYDVTKYLDYHPGGVEEITRIAGMDVTKAFEKYHAWVNYEFLLQSCLLGVYVAAPRATDSAAPVDLVDQDHA